MSANRWPPDHPQEWLGRARSDLALARASVPGVRLEDFCYHAQQAAEKALKGLLLQRAGSFPYVHDLAELVSRLEQSGCNLPDTIRAAVELSKYAVESRYPGLADPVTEPEWQAAVTSAEHVVNWVASQLPPVTPNDNGPVSPA